MIRSAYGWLVESILGWFDKPCCKNQKIVPRTWTNGVTEDWCENCGMYQKSPLRERDG
jgi:hypothetical protein